MSPELKMPGTGQAVEYNTESTPAQHNTTKQDKHIKHVSNHQQSNATLSTKTNTEHTPPSACCGYLPSIATSH